MNQLCKISLERSITLTRLDDGSVFPQYIDSHGFTQLKLSLQRFQEPVLPEQSKLDEMSQPVEPPMIVETTPPDEHDGYSGSCCG
jgi:hypothetical protein